uniref:NADP-dependent oxidoreductase domain-containing protein n=1 Tax=Acrobeloides nanus TaxID=290746 RepID=A0A914EI95_9BILA
MPLKPVPGPQLSVQEYVAKGEIEFDLTPHIETWRVQNAMSTYNNMNFMNFILLRQMLQRGIAVIPKSTNPARIRSNKEVFDFNLTTEEMENFKAIKDYRRFFGLEILKNHPYYPRK